MPHFSIHQLTLALSAKNVRSSLRLRKRKSSDASTSTTTSPNIGSSSSHVSIASSTIYRRHSIESITSTSTAASSALLSDKFDGLVNPYYVPTNIIKPSPMKTPLRKLTGNSITGQMVDLCGFHHSFVDAEEESFSPELAILEPRPEAPRFCGFEETLEQR